MFCFHSLLIINSFAQCFLFWPIYIDLFLNLFTNFCEFCQFSELWNMFILGWHVYYPVFSSLHFLLLLLCSFISSNLFPLSFSGFLTFCNMFWILFCFETSSLDCVWTLFTDKFISIPQLSWNYKRPHHKWMEKKIQIYSMSNGAKQMTTQIITVNLSKVHFVVNTGASLITYFSSPGKKRTSFLSRWQIPFLLILYSVCCILYLLDFTICVLLCLKDLKFFNFSTYWKMGHMFYGHKTG